MRNPNAAPAELADLAPLALEARWHTVSVSVVLPLILAGRAGVAVAAFGLFEMGLATAHRRHLLRRLPQRVVVPVEARQPL